LLQFVAQGALRDPGLWCDTPSAWMIDKTDRIDSETKEQCVITTSLIQMAIWTHLAVSHAAGMHFDIRAVFTPTTPHASIPNWCEHDETCDPAPTVERVVVREATFSEKYSLDIETLLRPDKEIVALQENAQLLKPALGNCLPEPKVTWQPPNIRYFRTDCEAQFAFSLDDDGEYKSHAEGPPMQRLVDSIDLHFGQGEHYSINHLPPTWDDVRSASANSNFYESRR
jgi:hypothetical protein